MSSGESVGRHHDADLAGLRALRLVHGHRVHGLHAGQPGGRELLEPVGAGDDDAQPPVDQPDGHADVAVVEALAVVVGGDQHRAPGVPLVVVGDPGALGDQSLDLAVPAGDAVGALAVGAQQPVPVESVDRGLGVAGLRCETYGERGLGDRRPERRHRALVVGVDQLDVATRRAGPRPPGRRRRRAAPAARSAMPPPNRCAVVQRAPPASRRGGRSRRPGRRAPHPPRPRRAGRGRRPAPAGRRGAPPRAAGPSSSATPSRSRRPRPRRGAAGCRGRAGTGCCCRVASRATGAGSRPAARRAGPGRPAGSCAWSRRRRTPGAGPTPCRSGRSARSGAGGRRRSRARPARPAARAGRRPWWSCRCRVRR